MADTIFALATAPGRAAVAVVRLSGPGTAAALQTLAGAPPKRRRPGLRVLRRPVDGAPLDQALVLWFPGPHSYTGEDVAELHLHGGAAVIDGVTEALLGLGLRLAQPGEFTRRAFENGKLDLSQAEAIGDLVEAETDAQRRQALAQLDGDLARRHAAWREALIEALALLEAAVDFPDEDLPAEVARGAAPLVSHVGAEIDAALAEGARGERVREGYRVALIGAPNAGKSSLLNALAGRDAAIVTPTPGTTRDIVEVALNLAGYRVVIGDTAGLRGPKSAVEAEGVRRAAALAETADLRLVVVDAAAKDERWRDAAALARAGDICVLNKRDLAPPPAAGAVGVWAAAHGLAVADISAARGIGLAELRETLTARVVAALSGGEFPAATRARHRQDLIAARGHLTRAARALQAPVEVELAAEDVRLAARSLARVNGRIDPEDVLDRVFARFCIGK
ncbi:MAG TPA: tRNA uridine-5-carboxymethylaminomethyl(34) synthesis GTPase MnmE [Caulobacteraceae bacterium]|jgi:tRNA modification GTPase|nr:tRNA uridine-5-carboxymethylaminomethyl(34) synthesis GTPase MnmE [Caulobacteraceae bacterium]